MQLFGLLFYIKRKPSFYAVCAEFYPFAEYLVNAHNARRTVYKNIEVARKAVLQRRHFVKLCHELVGIRSAL